MIDIDRKSDPYPPTMGAMARLVLELRAAGEPISISINGRGSLSVASEATVRQLFEFVDQLETIAVLNERLQAAETGGTSISLDEFQREMHQKYGIRL